MPSLRDRLTGLKGSKVVTVILVASLLIIGLSLYLKWTNSPLSKADSYYSDKDFEQAVISYKELLNDDSLNEDEIRKVKINLAKSLFEIANQALKSEQDKLAISSCLELIITLPKSAYLTSCKTKINTAFLNLTQPLLDDNQYVEILRLIKQVERRLGGSLSKIWAPKMKQVKIQSQFAIATNHSQEKQYYFAIAHFKELLALNPNAEWKQKIETHLQKTLFKDGIQEQRDNAYQNALDSFQELVKLFPNSSLAKQARPRIKSLKKQVQEQKKQWQSEAQQKAQQKKQLDEKQNEKSDEKSDEKSKSKKKTTATIES